MNEGIVKELEALITDCGGNYGLYHSKRLINLVNLIAAGTSYNEDIIPSPYLFREFFRVVTILERDLPNKWVRHKLPQRINSTPMKIETHGSHRDRLAGKSRS